MTASDDRFRGLATVWLREVAACTYVPGSADELEALLVGMIGTLAEALAATPFDTKPGVEVGARMVAGQLIGGDTLERSVKVLVDGLLERAGPNGTRNLVALLGAVSTGYAEAMRTRTLRQQEDMKRALLSAKQRAERVMRVTESRFREVFTSSPTGIAITDLDGRFIDANPALAEILARKPEALVGGSLADYLADDEPAGGSNPPRGRLKLIRGDGDAAWVYVAISPLREGPGEPESYVMTVQDLSELQLLQGQFGHQLLHDALTGVANRLYFESALETRLGRAAPEASVTLCCLNLDGFSVLNEGLGHQVGDRLLRTVATRLKGVVSQEEALVARTGGDEFAILIEDSPTTPEIPELVARINEALDEPEYIDGHGVGVTASIGVARCPAAATTGAELFRSADAALQSARTTGRRQWMRFDPDHDERTQRIHRNAAVLPGAFENGEIAVGYRPVVRLADRAPVAIRAVLRWDGRPDGPLDERETMRLAELTGQSVHFGPWLLGDACEKLPRWRLPGDARRGDAVLRVRLSRLQSADDHLIAAVRRATEAARLEPRELELAFDTAAVLDEFGSAADNLQVAAEIGVRTALCGFSGGPRELALLDRSPARSVVLADQLDGRDDGTAALPQAVELLVVAIKEIGAAVSVDGVWTDGEADRWASVGVDTGEGPLFDETGNLEPVPSGDGQAAQ